MTDASQQGRTRSGAEAPRLDTVAHGFVPHAEAEGAWVCSLDVGTLDPGTVRTRLEEVAAELAHPIEAGLLGGDAVHTVVLFRDPSREWGTPPVPECEATADLLADLNGWQRKPPARANGAVVVLGRRPGFSPAAPLYQPATARAILAQTCGAVSRWEAVPAYLTSVRMIDGRPSAYAEPGLLVRHYGNPTEVLAAVTGAAVLLGQRRVTITSLDTDHTTVLTRPCDCGNAG